MARFRQQFKVNAPLGTVWRLHEDPKALAELTPPPVKVQVLEMDRPLRAGARLRIRLSVGPFGVLWDVIYDAFDPYQPGAARCGFADRELRGPFHTWTHRHTFEALGDSASLITDDVRFELIGGLPGIPVNWLVVWPALAIMFLYRRFKTPRRLAHERANR
jgi:ligand-binding SRPBCC domain-containing protein